MTSEPNDTPQAPAPTPRKRISSQERKARERASWIVLPHPQGSAPLDADQIDRYFKEQRAARFPEQAKQAQELAKQKAMRAHQRDLDEAKRIRQGT
jgi:hypothetical protein